MVYAGTPADEFPVQKPHTRAASTSTSTSTSKVAVQVTAPPPPTGMGAGAGGAGSGVASAFSPSQTPSVDWSAAADSPDDGGYPPSRPVTSHRLSAPTLPLSPSLSPSPASPSSHLTPNQLRMQRKMAAADAEAAKLKSHTHEMVAANRDVAHQLQQKQQLSSVNTGHDSVLARNPGHSHRPHAATAQLASPAPAAATSALVAPRPVTSGADLQPQSHHVGAPTGAHGFVHSHSSLSPQPAGRRAGTAGDDIPIRSSGAYGGPGSVAPHPSSLPLPLSAVGAQRVAATATRVPSRNVSPAPSEEYEYGDDFEDEEYEYDVDEESFHEAELHHALKSARGVAAPTTAPTPSQLPPSSVRAAGPPAPPPSLTSFPDSRVVVVTPQQRLDALRKRVVDSGVPESTFHAIYQFYQQHRNPDGVVQGVERGVLEQRFGMRCWPVCQQVEQYIFLEMQARGSFNK